MGNYWRVIADQPHGKLWPKFERMLVKMTGTNHVATRQLLHERLCQLFAVIDLDAAYKTCSGEVCDIVRGAAADSVFP